MIYSNKLLYSLSVRMYISYSYLLLLCTVKQSRKIHKLLQLLNIHFSAVRR